MGKDVAAIRKEFQGRLSQIARELGRELYPEGLPRGTKFSELEDIAGALGDEMARQLIEIHVQGQADGWPEEELGECPLCGGPARKAPDQPRVRDHHAGGGRLEATRRELPPLSAGFFSLRTKRWALMHGLQPPRAAENRPCRGQQSFLSTGLTRSGRTGRPEGRTQARRAAGQPDRPGADRPARRRRGGTYDPSPDGERRRREPECPCPAVAMVSVDGGRLQVRTPPPSHASEPLPESSEPLPESSEPLPESSEPARKGHGRESKVAVLETYQSDVHEADPDPDVPRCFLDLKRTNEMVRGLGHALPTGLEFAVEKPSRETGRGDGRREQCRQSRPGRPERLVRSVLASRVCATNLARWSIRRPGSATSSGPAAGSSWGTDCQSTGRSSVGILVHSRRFSTSCMV